MGAVREIGCVFGLLSETTGMWRGEALALRRKDLDLEQGGAVVSRSVGRADNKVVVDSTKTDKTRVVDLDDITVSVLQATGSVRRRSAYSSAPAGSTRA